MPAADTATATAAAVTAIDSAFVSKESDSEFVKYLRRHRVPDYLIECLATNGVETLEDLRLLSVYGSRHGQGENLAEIEGYISQILHCGTPVAAPLLALMQRDLGKAMPATPAGHLSHRSSAKGSHGHNHSNHGVVQWPRGRCFIVPPGHRLRLRRATESLRASFLGGGSPTDLDGPPPPMAPMGAHHPPPPPHFDPAFMPPPPQPPMVSAAPTMPAPAVDHTPTSSTAKRPLSSATACTDSASAKMARTTTNALANGGMGTEGEISPGTLYPDFVSLEHPNQSPTRKMRLFREGHNHTPVPGAATALNGAGPNTVQELPPLEARQIVTQLLAESPARHGKGGPEAQRRAQDGLDKVLFAAPKEAGATDTGGAEQAPESDAAGTT
eukprot:Clim_evm1s16 gene=Clim_evmTU1s16